MIKMHHFKIYCEIIVSPSVINRALKVSLIVGTTLNLINQGEALVALDVANVSLVKLGFTYFVPFSVTTYTATTMKLEFLIGTKAIVEADLICKKCGYETHVQENELIPECPACGINTHWKLK